MPNRYVREDILDSERVDALSAEAEVFYRRLMSKADDYGRFHGDWRKLRAALYPLRVEKITEKLIERLLVEVSVVIKGRPLVRIYQSGDERFLEITKFDQQQRSKSKFPDPNQEMPSSDRRCLQMPSSDPVCLQLRSDSDSISDSSSTSLSSSSEGSAEGNQVAPLEEALERNSVKIQAGHPAPRRDIGKGQVKTGLKAILRYKRLSGSEAVAYLDELGERHGRMCQSEQWIREGGVYAKGLNNYLAPTIERYEQEPPPLAVPGTYPVRDGPQYQPDTRPLSEVFLR